MIAFKTLFTTFYSYKGGVGRTSALVNTALLRAISGDRVVVLDFDLEAPGVSSYVKELAIKNKKNIDLDSRPGILDYLYEATENNQIPKIRNNAISGADLGLKMDGEIWFIGAGNTTDKEYSKKLGLLNWVEIFEKKQGALLLENLKRQIIGEFNHPDYVFVDSRTGITEIGGVCTRYLADLVVVLSSLNEQNILGTSRIYNAFKESNIATILVASNVPVGLPWGNDQLFTDRIENFTAKFHSRPDLLIYHYPSLSLMEYLPSYFKLKDEGSILNEDPLLKSYETLSGKIESKNENSFDKFLNEIFGRILFLNTKREKELEEAFIFFNKHYENRIKILNVIKNIHDLKKIIDAQKNENINNDFFDKLNQLKNSRASLNRYPNLLMLRRMVLDNASELVVAFYSKNNTQLHELHKWYSILSNNAKLDAIMLLISISNFEFVYNSISKKQLNGFFILAKAYASEKIKKADSKKYYELFLKNTHDNKLESASIFFSCAYASFKVNKSDLARNFLLKAEEYAKKEDEQSSFFIPTKFTRVKSVKAFLKELSEFKENCNVTS